MLFLKTTNSVYTIFPILTLPYHNRSAFNEKQLTLDSLLSWENFKKKKNWWNPKMYFQGIFCYEQESCRGSSLLRHSIHITCKPQKKFSAELKPGKFCPWGNWCPLSPWTELRDMSGFLCSFWEQKGQMQIQVISITKQDLRSMLFQSEDPRL